jgi:hypothetical protein
MGESARRSRRNPRKGIMGIRYVATRNVESKELGFADDLGLLLVEGRIYDSLLPDIEAALLKMKAIEKDADFFKRQTKMKPAPTENK